MIGWEAGRRWHVAGIEQSVRAIEEVIARGDLGGVVLTGPAGVGKSLLAAAVLERAAAAGRATARLVATPSGSGVPLGVLRPVLSVSDAPHDRAQLVREVEMAVSGLLDGSSDGARPVLVVDDLPLIDRGSADVLMALVRSRSAFVLATARTGMVLPAEIDGALVDGTLVVRPVAPLDREQLGRAVGASLSGPVAAEAVDLLWELSRGVPLHARELVQVNVEAGVLAPSEGRWQFLRPPEAPPSLVELVASRFVQLDEERRRSFEALCLAQPLPLEVAAELVGLDLLEELEGAGLVAVASEVGVPTVRLGHPLFDEVVRARLRPVRRRQAAVRAVGALEAVDPDADLLLRAACLRMEHRLPMAPGATRAAAQRALSLVDPVLAERLLEAAKLTGFEAALLLGNALTAQGRHGEADAALRSASQAAANDEERARAVSRRGNNLGTGAGRFEDSLEVLIAGLATITDPRWRSFVEADLAYARLWLGRDQAGPAADVDVDPPRSTSASKPDVVRANECLVGAVVAVMGGALSRAESFVDEGLPLAPALLQDVPTARELLTLSRFLALAFGGDRAAASTVVAVELERAQASSAGAPGTWMAVRAMQALVDGALGAAVADAEDAERRLGLVDISGLRPLAQAVRAVALAQLGDHDASAAAAAEIEPAWRDETKVQTLLAQAAAWQEVLAGRASAAAELLCDAAETAFDADHVPMGALAAYDAVRLGYPRRAVGVLVGGAERWEGPLAEGLRDHARCLSAEQPGSLVEIAGRLPGLGATIGGAEAAMQAARLFEGAGQVDEARRAEYLASATITSLGPSTSLTLGRPRGLTRREREVAEAAARGRPSRGIADDLGLSTRTVDNHLASAYRKLGVSSRAHLRRTLGQARDPRPGG